MNSNAIYSLITDRIISAIEAGGIAPWRKPWVTSASNAPRNPITGKLYRGINVFLLGACGFEDPRWMTFNQAKAKGGMVRKGQKGCPVVFWKWIEIETENGKEEIPYLRYYTVFNVSQIDGLKLPKFEREVRTVGETLDAADTIIRNYIDGPEVVHGGNVASYSPRLDRIAMPRQEDFESYAAYASTIFHEMSHSVGHASRLNRPGIADFDGFGSQKYAKEELIAELGAAFLCGHAGIENLDQSAAYVDNWLHALKNDKKLIVQAAAAAQKSADWVMNIRGAVKEEEEVVADTVDAIAA